MRAVPLLPETNGPRSPLRVAVITFGAVCLIGMLVGVTILTLTGKLHDDSYARGEQFGQGLAPVAFAAAVIAYFVQKRKLEKK